MWNEEKQKQLEEAENIVATLKSERANDMMLKYNTLKQGLSALDTMEDIDNHGSIAQFLLDNRDAVIKLLEDIK